MVERNFIMMNLDFSNVPSREPIEEGHYTLRIAKAEEKISKNGNPMLSVEYDIVGMEGRKLWDNYVLTDKALWKMQELCKALGYDTETALTLDPVDLVGQEVIAKVIQEEFEGDIVNRVKKILPSA